MQKILLTAAVTLMATSFVVAQSNTPQYGGVSYQTQAAKNAHTWDNYPNVKSMSNATCADLNPFCTQPGTSFVIYSAANSGDANITNPGNDYNCLGTTPNPAWYYMEIGSAGSIDLLMTSQMNVDIDFALWGPFASKAQAESICGNYFSVIDCSYSTAATEFINIPNGQPGEVYVLLITNFANITSNIDLSQIGGTGTLNCQNMNIVSGTIYNDANGNCVADGGEQGIPNIIIQSNSSYSVTDTAGNYTVIADSGTYNIQPILPSYLSPLASLICDTAYSIYFDTVGIDTTGFNFYLDALQCPYLSVDVSSTLRRRCFQNNTYVEYCNVGFADTNNVSVFVELPEYVHLISADHAYTVDANGVYEFFIGSLAAGECGTIHIIDSVACDTGIVGLVQCYHAWITPPNSCVEGADTSNNSGVWDQSSMMVTGYCVGDTVVRFVIHNTGDPVDGDMEGTSEYRIYIDGLLVYTGTFQIAGGDDFIVEIPATGGVVRLEADQRPGHPGNSHPNDVIQGCGDGSQTGNLNNWLAFNAQSTDDGEITVEEDCLPIVDSYDPNDKQVSPGGAGAQHVVMPGTLLDYTIRFQNTGSAPAFTVIVKDTLPAYLNVASIQLGVTSHAMDFSTETTANGDLVLVFTFNNINLVDSLSDPVNSIGFLKFKAAPRADVPNGTVIENRAGIYFDFNEPIITNYAWVTIDEQMPTGNPIDVTIVSSTTHALPHRLDIAVYPNPTKGVLNLDLRQVLSQANVQVLNLNGQVLMQQTIDNQQFTQIDLNNLPAGIYMLQVVSAQQSAVLKVVKQ